MTPSSFEVFVPATSANLGPGFDCFGLALPFGNTFQVTPSARSRFTLEGEGADRTLEGDSNRFLLAARRLAVRIGRELPSVEVVARCEIPFLRGLGSSASATVGGLVAANRLFGEPLDTPELLGLATDIEGHPDNAAPALMGGVTLSFAGPSGVVCQPLPVVSEIGLVVAIPEFELATAAARGAVPSVVPLKDAVYNVGRAALLVVALSQGRTELLAEALSDRLHQPYRERLVPGMGRVSEAARAAGAWNVTLSGSGPTLLAWGPREAEAAIAEAMEAAWKAGGVLCRTMVTGVHPFGASVRPVPVA
jgi:homoserine kinase